MRFGYVVENNKLKWSKTGLWLQQISTQALVRLAWRDPKFAEGLSENLLSRCEAVKKLLGTTDNLFFVLDVDPVSNMISVTAPIVYEEDGTIAMHFDFYDEAIRDSAWPSATLDADVFYGVCHYSVPKDMRIGDKAKAGKRLILPD